MTALSIIYLFYGLKIAFAMLDQEDIITVHLPTFEKDDTDFLKSLDHNEILPLVMVQSSGESWLKRPRGMKTIVTKGGMMINGSKFYAEPPGKQIFLCRKKDSNPSCLIPRSYTEFERLKCEEEPIPAVEIASNRRCGSGGTGAMYKFVYKICNAPEGYSFDTESLLLYKFCYDNKNQKTIYTEHGINSVFILRENHMIRERQVQYEMINGFGDLIPAIHDLKKSPYKVHKLVPPDDMAFATWRKTTFNYINTALLHEALTETWDEISSLIRNYDEHTFTNRHYIYTGSFDIPVKTNEGTSGPNKSPRTVNVWIKMIASKYSEFLGLAILMNNFLTEEQPQPGQPNLEHAVIDNLCKMDFCAKDLKVKFATLGAGVRCCEVTKDIQQFFSSKIDIKGLLKIPKLIDFDLIHKLEKQGIVI